MSINTKTVFAFTDPSPTAPGYINLTKNEDGTTTISVRSSGNGGSAQSLTVSQDIVDNLTDAMIESYYITP